MEKSIQYAACIIFFGSKKLFETENSLQIGGNLFCQTKVSHHRRVAAVITFDQAVLWTQKTIIIIFSRLVEEVTDTVGLKKHISRHRNISQTSTSWLNLTVQYYFHSHSLYITKRELTAHLKMHRYEVWILPLHPKRNYM